jgi:hypothetical protein
MTGLLRQQLSAYDCVCAGSNSAFLVLLITSPGTSRRVTVVREYWLTTLLLVVLVSLSSTDLS